MMLGPSPRNLALNSGIDFKPPSFEYLMFKAENPDFVFDNPDSVVIPSQRISAFDDPLKRKADFEPPLINKVHKVAVINNEPLKP